MYYTRLDGIVLDPEDLHGLRARVDGETSGNYARFRNGLTPDYPRVWRDLTYGIVALGMTVIATGLIGPAAIAIGALLIGYEIAYLQLFMHEAAHFGLAADRKNNDRIADCLICWMVGTDAVTYRATHWAHHRWLGSSEDTEITYRSALRPGFLLGMLTGFHAVRVFLFRKEIRAEAQSRKWRPLFIGMAAHGSLLAGLVFVGWWTAAVAWLAGMAIFFPFFATLRPLLEHRPTEAHAEDAAITRLFGDDFFSRTFGGAGFNRHMLHHLEPQVSYTRLPDLERYLMTTSASAELNVRRSTYSEAFAALLVSDRNG